MKTTDYSGLKMQILARMKSGAVLMISFFMTTAFVATSSAVMADEPATPSSSSAASSAAVLTDMRYGFFNWLDHRSAYGQGAFPEPFLVDDSDLEVNEARLDWLHTQANHERSDVVTAEIEKGFGLLTLEVEVPFEYDAATRPATPRKVSTISIWARAIPSSNSSRTPSLWTPPSAWRWKLAYRPARRSARTLKSFPRFLMI